MIKKKLYETLKIKSNLTDLHSKGLNMQKNQQNHICMSPNLQQHHPPCPAIKRSLLCCSNITVTEMIKGSVTIHCFSIELICHFSVMHSIGNVNSIL